MCLFCMRVRILQMCLHARMRVCMCVHAHTCACVLAGGEGEQLSSEVPVPVPGQTLQSQLGQPGYASAHPRMHAHTSMRALLISTTTYNQHYMANTVSLPRLQLSASLGLSLCQSLFLFPHSTQNKKKRLATDHTSLMKRNMTRYLPIHAALREQVVSYEYSSNTHLACGTRHSYQ